MKNKLIACFAAAVFAVTLTAADLSAYKPVDPTKNILKNGGFESANIGVGRIDLWGKMSPSKTLDGVIKRSGRYSLKIGNVPQSYAAIYYTLGIIEKLDNDLLIRGWYRYENIDIPKKISAPFIGIWTNNKQGGNSKSFKLVDVPAGSNAEWTQFEVVLKADLFKAECAKVNPAPYSFAFRINQYMQSGWLWLDDIEIIPLEKK